MTSAVQDARGRLVSADENCGSRKSSLSRSYTIARRSWPRRGQMETARANKAGADGFLRGAYVTRADQLNLNGQSNSGNNVFLTGMDPYFRAYYGLGSF